jgi:hypothetical protein
MSLPFSGPLSLNDIRIEQNQSTKSPYDLIGASTAATGYSIINQDSFFKPNNTPPYSISEWYGYSAFTITWSNISNTKLNIYVNNILALDTSATLSGVLDIKLNDTFYATFTPLSYGAFTTLNLSTYQRNTTSPFPYITIQTISRSTPSTAPNSTSATPITVTPNALGIGAYKIDTFGL